MISPTSADSSPITPTSLCGLRIAVDARRRTAAGGVGVAMYSTMLIRALNTLGAQVELVTDAHNDGPGAMVRWRRWLAAASGPRQLEPVGGPSGQGWFSADLFRIAQAHFNLYGELLTVRCPTPPEVMHWSYPLPLRMAGARNVYTVHDTIPIDNPELTGISRRRHKRLLQRVNAAADHIFTVSEHSRLALARVLGRPAESITNTYQAVLAAEPVPDLPLPAPLVPGGYYLFCGSVEPRKNLSRLVEAHRQSRVHRPLVIAGPDGWRADRALPSGIVADGRVIRLPWQERSVLSALIAQARALLFPSLAEGFGLPVAEAMAFGVPVMTSDQGALAEVAGGAALLVDPYDITAMATAVKALDGDETLRTRLIQAGRLRSTFTEAAYAERLRQAYRGLMTTPPRD